MGCFRKTKRKSNRLTMKAQSSYCKNCNSVVEDNFCSRCGQRTTIHKITFSETFHDLVGSLFLEEGPLWQSLKLLVLNPGKMFREYLAGRRKTYYKPVTFFILMTALYLVIRSIINYDPFGSNLMQVQDPTSGQLLLKARNFFLFNIDKLLFVFVFSLGLMMKLFFYRKNTLAEFLAISFFLMAIYTILTILNMFYIRYIDKSFQGIHIIIMTLYFIYAMVSFFQKNKALVIIKSLVVYALSFFLYGFGAFSIAVFIVWIKNS